MQKWRDTAYNRAAFVESKQLVSLLFTRLSYNANDTFNFNLDRINRMDKIKDKDTKFTFPNGVWKRVDLFLQKVVAKAN